ncbi:MAG TPA: aminotransferase class I/II-fold pyridoxal phosphate-dependent enzyme [Thermoanaerobaculia bacterium]|nr:aminotransferase class I/II-fold pyridoxal phosphate-dependent enzyme [Thermoanaerobaculia bacterium]
MIYSGPMLPRNPALPFSRPEIGEEEISEVVRCLQSGWITTGPLTAQFEQEFAAATGAKHALSFSSCTGALHVCFLAMGLQEGDEVIVPALTWPATANMVIAAGATPVFADIDPVTWNLDPAAVAAVLSPRTRAVVPVHFAGQPADLEALSAVLAKAGREDVQILEDAAHAAGSAYKGRPIGGSAANGTLAACFSFHPIKNMTTGEGGMVTTDDDALADQIKLWRFHGVRRDAWKAYSASEKAPASYDVVLPGFKYNLTDIQSALGIHQLRKLPRFNARRAEIAGEYNRQLASVPGLGLPGRAAYEHHHPWHLFTVLAPDRAEFMDRLKQLGIGTGLHFEAVHLHAYYRERYGYTPGCLPVAEEVCARIVSLPLFPSMTDADVQDVVTAVKEAVERAAA